MGKNRKHKGQQQKSPANHENPPSESGPDSSTVYTVRVDPSAEDKDRNSNEKEYWKKQIWSGQLLNWITSVGTGVALLGLIFLWRTVGDTHKSADAAMSAANTADASLRIGERPWIEVATTLEFQHPNPLSRVEMMYVDTPIPINFPFTVIIGAKNHGHSPALHAYAFIETKWIDVPGLMDNPAQIAPPIASGCDGNAPYKQTGDEALFPGSGYTYPSLAQIIGKPVADKMRKLQNAFFAYGCIRYKDSFNLTAREFYQTNFCRYYWLGDTPHRWQPCHGGNGVW